MAREKRAKAKIKRRPPGLVITPPSPRPVEADHPARLLFREAIESAKAAPEPEISKAETTAEAAQIELPTPVPEISAAIEAPQVEPLNIFKELKSKAAANEKPPAQPAAVPRREHSGAFEAHFGQWRPFLPEAQMCVLEALFNMTHAVGRDRCLTSMPKVAAAAGISERQTYNVVKELEKYGFVERPETFNTPTKEGTVFRLHLNRQTSLSGVNRRYHYGD